MSSSIDTNALVEKGYIRVRSEPTDDQRALRYAWLGWVVLFLVITGLIVSGNTRMLTTDRWMAASDCLADMIFMTALASWVRLPSPGSHTRRAFSPFPICPV